MTIYPYRVPVHEVIICSMVSTPFELSQLDPVILATIALYREHCLVSAGPL